MTENGRKISGKKLSRVERDRERERGGKGKTGRPSFPLMFPVSSSTHADNGVIRHAGL